MWFLLKNNPDLKIRSLNQGYSIPMMGRRPKNLTLGDKIMENIEKLEREATLNRWLIEGVETLMQLQQKIKTNIRGTNDPKARKYLLSILRDDNEANALLGLDKPVISPAVEVAYGAEIGWV
jgi:hypothetical protein